MKYILALLSPFWVAVPFVIERIIEEQGKLVGGSQYFGHMGMGLGIAAEYGLAAIAALMAVLLVANIALKVRVRPLLRALSLVFAISTLAVYLGVLFASPGVLAFIPLRVFPRETYSWFPGAAITLGVLTFALSSWRAR